MVFILVYQYDMAWHNTKPASTVMPGAGSIRSLGVHGVRGISCWSAKEGGEGEEEADHQTIDVDWYSFTRPWALRVSRNFHLLRSLTKR